MSTRLIRNAVAPLIVAGGLALAQPALATDYCVTPNASCGAGNVQSFQAALDAAALNAGPDRVFLGATTYTAPSQGFIYDPMNANDPIEIAGEGNQATILKGTSGAYRTLAIFGGSGTSVHDLHVVMPPAALSGAQAFRTNGTARNVSVTEVIAQQQNDDRTGVVLLPGGSFQQGFVGLDTNAGTMGLAVSGGGRVSDSASYASTSLVSGGATIERSVLVGRIVAVALSHGSTAISNSRLATSESGSVALGAGHLDGDVNVQVDGATLDGPDDATNGGTAVSLDNAYTPAYSVDVGMKNTLIRGYASNLWVGASDAGSGHVHLDASYSDYDSSLETVVGSKASVAESHVSFIGDGPFTDDEDLFPLVGMGIIDAGDPNEPQGKDLAGNPLVTDGDGDGVARRDIGALELATQPLKPVPGDASPAGAVDPSSAVPPVNPMRDTLAPALSGLRFSHKVFAVGHARTAIAARTVRGTRLSYTLSESAKVIVKIQRVGAKRAAGKLSRASKTGLNTIAFSGRIGAKALKAGRYRAVITATDATGNRSAAKTVSFRIVMR